MILSFVNEVDTFIAWYSGENNCFVVGAMYAYLSVPASYTTLYNCPGWKLAALYFKYVPKILSNFFLEEDMFHLM